MKRIQQQRTGTGQSHSRGRVQQMMAALRSVFVLASLFVAAQASAQAQLGAIQGTVTQEENGKPLSSVTIVVNGPALQEFQTEVSDAAGKYIITQLPPGDDYRVEFFYGADDKPRVVRPGIRLSQGKTITVNAVIALSSVKKEVRVIRETAPIVDTASASTGVEVNQEMMRYTPVRGRTFDSVISLAPGAADVAPRPLSKASAQVAGGEVGASVSGSTGAENAYYIDGINTADPNTGVAGTELNNAFVKEVSVMTGGYQAEYGRATGGVISVLTKSGGNEFHGSFFGSIQPFQLAPRGIARLGEAIVTRTKTSMLFDVGFDLGGYLWKDRIWFYVGFAPTFETRTTQRRVRQQTYDPSTGGAAVDPNFSCPDYLRSSDLCAGPRLLALRTTEIDGSGADYDVSKRLYNGIAKLQFNFSPDHNLTLGYIASPTTFDEYVGLRNVDVDSQRSLALQNTHDVNARYIGKLFQRKLQVDIMYGYHYQGFEERPDQLQGQSVIWNASPSNPYSLADFENVPGCQRQTVQFNGIDQAFNPCPLTTYTRGYGLYRSEVQQRHMINASLTLFHSFTDTWNPLRGVHAIKAGVDVELLFADNGRAYTGTDFDPMNPEDATRGHRVFRTSGSGNSVQITREFARPWSPECPHPDTGDGICHFDRFRGLTQTRNFAVYLRDSWNIGWAPGLVLNAGVRWEGQEVYGQDLDAGFVNPRVGNKVIGIYDNIAPRIGLAWDFTSLTERPGRGKVFFNFGRFYQSIPTNLNDRQFTGEGLISSGAAAYGANQAADPDCYRQPLQPGGRAISDPSGLPNCKYPDQTVNGGTYGIIGPGLQGQFINEIVLGITYDVGWDTVLGATFVHRDLGNIIEDVSTDGGSFYFLTNPGQQPDPKRVAELQTQIDSLQTRVDQNPSDAKLAQELDTAKRSLDGYQSVGTIFPRAVRNYNAITLSINKRLSDRFSLLANYTYSRTIGNYPGAFSSSNAQLDPNISSQFDLTDLLANRNGPLPNDRPHNFKMTGFYLQPIGANGKLSFGLTFTAYSGRPIEVLGSHLYYGSREVYLLPRGSGGRTPTVSQFDLSVGYDHSFSRGVQLRLSADVINLFNQRQITNVDDEFTVDNVSAIPGGTIGDLRHLRTLAGESPTYNSNYGQPRAFQAPLAIRFGGRLSF